MLHWFADRLDPQPLNRRTLTIWLFPQVMAARDRQPTGTCTVTPTLPTRTAIPSFRQYVQRPWPLIGTTCGL
jgi:hypothetical protein